MTEARGDAAAAAAHAGPAHVPHWAEFPSVAFYCSQVAANLSSPTNCELPVSKINHWNSTGTWYSNISYQRPTGALPCTGLGFPSL